MSRTQIEEDIVSQDIRAGDVISIGGVDFMAAMTHKNDDNYTAPSDYSIWVYFVLNMLDENHITQTVNFKDSYIIFQFNLVVHVRRWVDE
jgi:hypothetical protein